MKTQKERGMLSNPVFDSRIHSANTQTSEKVLGYFMGPALLYMAYYCVAGTYLTQFYTDVLGITGIFLTWMPLFSKIFDAFTNVVMGQIIDRTRTRQGKARPWLLLSGFLIAVSGVLLYAVPHASRTVQLVWIVVSYNLFFALAFTIYNMSHTLMVPLSTRNTKQRDGLAMITSMGASMIPGMLVTIVMPLMIRAFGVGSDAQGTWIKMMSILSVLAIPAVLLEYYFTKERVTEDAQAAENEEEKDRISFRQQVSACFKDPYWLIIMGLIAVYQIAMCLSTNSMVYYCNWVLGNSVNTGATKQILVNMIGQAPLGIGIVILWPLVRKFGKRRVMQVGFAFGGLGSLVVLLSGSNMGAVLGGLVLKSFGALPTYTLTAMIAEALDHIEWKNGYRADGFSASVYSILVTVSAGIAQTILIGGISGLGYISPSSAAEAITQPGSIQTFFTWCFAGAIMIAYLIGSLLMTKYDVENKMPQITEEITERHKAEARARGIEYLSPQEKAELEQKEQDRIAEQKRIEELKAKCAKKGLDFAAEEAKYQQKLAEQRAKKEAKAAKKRK